VDHGPQAVLQTLDPGGQIVKIVYDELVADARWAATAGSPLHPIPLRLPTRFQLLHQLKYWAGVFHLYRQKLDTLVQCS
jgi:hypothetical protein